MRTDFQKVGDFHKKFEIPYVESGTMLSSPQPRQVASDVVEFRTRFMQEELDEWKAACEAGDDAKAFDALLDLAYVVLGTAHVMGYPWPEGFEMVHRANMAKERASSARDARSARGHALDVVKPAGWAAPDIEWLLRSFGW